MPMTLTRCVPCARDGETRLAVDIDREEPVCGPCLVETRRFRLLADLGADAPAKVRVPAMKRGRVPNPEPA